MKKIIFTLAMVVCTTLAFAQSTTTGIQSNGGSRDTHNFQCMDDDVFSQIPVEFNTSGYCDAGYDYTTIAEDYTSLYPISSLRFWGVNDIKGTETFLIKFYNGQPDAPGTSVIHTFNVTTTPVATTTLYGLSTVYQFDVDFGILINQLNGWFSISRTTLPYVSTFAWMAYNGGPSGTGNAMSYRTSTGLWYLTGWESDGHCDMFFCLGLSEGYHDFECMNQSNFGQVPNFYDIGVYCDAGYVYTKVADDYTASYPFSNMRFWGVYDVKPTETFLIEFYNGVPGAVGTTIVKTYNVTINPVTTPYTRNGSVIHQFDVNFGETITLLNGWVSISRTTLPFITQFAWIGLEGAGNNLSYYSGVPQWESGAREMFFCLGVGMHDFECMDNAQFSQVPDVYTNAYFCDADYDFSKVADNYSVSAPFSSMRFWAGSFYDFDIQAGETFLIEFYNGQPGQPGTSIVKTFNVTGNRLQVPYQLVGTDLYQIDVVFPEVVTQLNGWVSISRTTPSNTGTFGWLTFEDASGEFVQYYSPDAGNWVTVDGYQFFCLGPVTPLTPLSNWALYLGIGLILAFTVIRLRKIF